MSWQALDAPLHGNASRHVLLHALLGHPFQDAKHVQVAVAHAW